ncbi:hypothetical protein CSC70_07870 [Pseudoxanthomonas kalamensis DSM 18571]|uniref:SlyX family protein n=1 Tax=Pseudoxanthomonas kalamensis TaxID=289483 RepID=UPI0013912217|nr:SlyX family protein [Pseudoxanthomonas kalamensis]KAF1710566.1 hypothetical protein CSC70_07870 [Pseudoxanthomonas kalamensis DSM 18571]
MQHEAPSRERSLEQRLIELETRLAFQEQAMLELSEVLAEARAESGRNSETLRHLLADLRKVRSELYASPQDEPPPPHY